MAESKVSLRGLKCPLPALKTRKLLERMAAGDVLIIECTDPLTTIDIPNLLRETGDALEHSTRKGKVLTFHIRKIERKAEFRSGGRPQARKPARRKSK
jgi:tRNA 2-thiouridine synthesizing protein A